MMPLLHAMRRLLSRAVEAPAPAYAVIRMVDGRLVVGELVLEVTDLHLREVGEMRGVSVEGYLLGCVEDDRG